MAQPVARYTPLVLLKVWHMDEATIEMLRSSVREFCNRELAPIAQEIDHKNNAPIELWTKLGNLGVLGMTVPEAYGGSAMGYLAHAVVMEEISTASASVGLSYGAHSNLCINQINLHGTEEQKQKYLPKLCSGEHIGALAMSENTAGSDVMSMKLKAEKVADGFKLNGHKMWITNAPIASTFVVYARTSADKITAFIVEKGLKGFSVAQKLDKLGMRGSDTAELVFEDCTVPAANILGELDGGSKVLMSGLNYERLILAAGPVGIMQAAMNIALPYIQERKQFGKAIGEFELVQGLIADMYSSLSAARAYLYKACRDADVNKITNEDAAAVILFCSEAATQVALKCIQCLGGNGYINEYPAGRLLRDAKLYEIGAGTSEIRRMIIGRELMKK